MSQALAPDGNKALVLLSEGIPQPPYFCPNVVVTFNSGGRDAPTQVRVQHKNLLVFNATEGILQPPYFGPDVVVTVNFGGRDSPTLVRGAHKFFLQPPHFDLNVTLKMSFGNRGALVLLGVAHKFFFVFNASNAEGRKCTPCVPSRDYI
ncbi:hypothetical protein V5799_022144 [Amblyomma americanum]|uniref:Uncharacterized protein n=1 Tax=Amblyomma americanum TaxID=6943 RepID=A0AAQ4FLL7_AMBAM